MEEKFYICGMPSIFNNDISHQTYSGVENSSKVLYVYLAVTSRSFYPATSISDFIENKTTEGDLTLIKSMIQIPFTLFQKSVCSNLKVNIRPQIDKVTAAKPNFLEIDICT